MRSWLSALSAAFILAMGAAEPLAAAPRNIVLYVSDDQGQDAGCYGNEVLQTPHLDALAADGVRFEYAFCTTASCSPSRSVILSGLYSHATGQFGLEHAYHHFRSFENLKTLPARLAEAGYHTVRIGKYHVGPAAAFPFETVLEADARNPVAMANHCRDLIAGADTRPFFLYFCPTDPHRSGTRLEESPERPDRFGNRPSGYAGVTEIEYDPADVDVPDWLPDRPACRAELAQYYQSISRVDQGLGALVAILKETGRYDDTLVAYISDHGAPFPGAKTTVYEPGLRAPCVVHHPGATRRGIVSQAMVSWVDLAPTLLDYAQVPVAEDQMHGRSFLNILEEESPSGWDEIYAAHNLHEVTMYYPMRCVRTRRYKLIWNLAHPLPFPFASDLWESATWRDALQGGPASPYGMRTVEEYVTRPRYELYQIEIDPLETVNLADDPAYAEMLVELVGKLQSFQERTADPWQVKWMHE